MTHNAYTHLFQNSMCDACRNRVFIFFLYKKTSPLYRSKPFAIKSFEIVASAYLLLIFFYGLCVINYKDVDFQKMLIYFLHMHVVVRIIMSQVLLVRVIFQKQEAWYLKSHQSKLPHILITENKMVIAGPKLRGRIMFIVHMRKYC